MSPDFRRALYSLTDEDLNMDMVRFECCYRCLLADIGAAALCRLFIGCACLCLLPHARVQLLTRTLLARNVVIQLGKDKDRRVEGKSDGKEKKARLIPIELQSLFTRLQVTSVLRISTDSRLAADLACLMRRLPTRRRSPRSRSPRALGPPGRSAHAISPARSLHEAGTVAQTGRNSLLCSWQGSAVYQQHDVSELNRILIDAIERSLVGTRGEQIMQTLYRGANQVSLPFFACPAVLSMCCARARRVRCATSPVYC